ncbi:hypothetical protein CSOJ01_05863 [Colletotrichum sojae]|uniref:non-specific serine/threonine protein kinase n=1 Tax=Colletotrichum sojae TaxID=2175907 RepID=A0A8H6JDL7_9PEZI|nr:hypothetical protein CSOJ01_05863 [Colletotrichum sojae]
MAPIQLPNAISIHALAASLLSSPCFFILKTETESYSGGEYLVYPLESTCGRRICIRIPKETHQHTGFQLERETNIRRRIDAAGIDLFQPLIAADPTADNSLHMPFMALGWADGATLKWSDSNPASEDERRRYISGVANATLDLLRIQEAGKTASDWIKAKINRKIARAKAGTLPGGTVAECQQQMQLVQKYWIPELDDAPHILVHGDLSSNNVIVDDYCNVKGIIDLGWAELVPLQFAAVYPRFLTHEPSESDGLDWTARDTKQMEQDRAFYLECIRTRANQEGGILLDYLRVISRQDEVSRYWWLTAASRIDIHRAMASCEWDPPIGRNRSMN